MDIKEERIAYLQQQSGVQLDYSEKSLNELWEWFLSRAEVEETPEARMAELREAQRSFRTTSRRRRSSG